MTPKEIADSLRAELDEHLVEMRKIADMIEALEKYTTPQLWMLYPLDRAWPISGEFGVTYTIGGITWQHEGIDIACPVGCSVHACAAGVVTFAGWFRGYGNHIRITHALDGIVFQSWYGHLDSIGIQLGKAVIANQVVGVSGVTGNVTGAHLHLTILDSTSNFKPVGCSESLRGAINPRSVIQFPP